MRFSGRTRGSGPRCAVASELPLLRALVVRAPVVLPCPVPPLPAYPGPPCASTWSWSLPRVCDLPTLPGPAPRRAPQHAPRARLRARGECRPSRPPTGLRSLARGLPFPGLRASAPSLPGGPARHCRSSGTVAPSAGPLTPARRPYPRSAAASGVTRGGGPASRAATSLKSSGTPAGRGLSAGRASALPVSSDVASRPRWRRE